MRRLFFLRTRVILSCFLLCLALTFVSLSGTYFTSLVVVPTKQIYQRIWVPKTESSVDSMSQVIPTSAATRLSPPSRNLSSLPKTPNATSKIHTTVQPPGVVKLLTKAPTKPKLKDDGPPIPPKLEACKLTGLGTVPVDIKAHEISEIEKKYRDVRHGGVWKPYDCLPLDRVAILVPYRDRFENLKIFLNHMHGFLQKQKLQYGIFVVEQGDKKQFNRAKLMNVGYVEILKLGDYNCFVVHDIDKLPDNSENVYTCQDAPKAMMVSHKAQNEKSYKGLFYMGYFGGVSAVSKDQYKKINGASNIFWGWGGEDDDFYRRVTSIKKVTYLSQKIGRYTVLSHHDDMHLNKDRFRLLSGREFNKRHGRDGLNSLSYKLVEVKAEPLYTRITAEL
ncbi:beta-1,4-galactosyltransferase 4-like isoform X2 [Lineus longissimus]|uniref:beta-1,4-galactosyltransferase 4-like isoform X2 n=1 Tax=Lineus longissimus TaxID=88925 RepID=UPI00315D2D9D